jgi:beta,beta-carotene 9',10'-dioxygenase
MRNDAEAKCCASARECRLLKYKPKACLGNILARKSIVMTNTDVLGYTSLEEEITLDRLPIEGTIPSWLTGSLLRNGPAKFEVGQEKFRHWFDGFAMLHRFSFHDGKVSYANKFLQSDAYKTSMKEGRITFGQFATDPCKAIFKGSMTEMVNANVSINTVAGEYVAMTETPLPVVFDPCTLETLGVAQYDDQVSGQHGSAHPHYDFVKRMSVSYLTEFGMQSKFQVYAILDGEHRRTLIGSYPVLEPAYIHSFAMTEHYIVIAEYPYRVNPLALITSGKPFIENYTWRPQEGTQFIVMDKHAGTVVARCTSEAFFAFHHINAFERDGEVIVDISAYPDASSVGDLYLDRLRAAGRESAALTQGEFRRYHLHLNGMPVTHELLADQSLELPTINYRRYNTHDYGVAYGVSVDRQDPAAFTNQLIRVDTRTRTKKLWSVENCYPGEPVFAEAPHARGEDDGIVLSVVLNAYRGNSFLLVLDAHTFEEIGRAEVPHHIPFGFHGQYFPGVK